MNSEYTSNHIEYQYYKEASEAEQRKAYHAYDKVHETANPKVIKEWLKKKRFDKFSDFADHAKEQDVF